MLSQSEDPSARGGVDVSYCALGRGHTGPAIGRAHRTPRCSLPLRPSLKQIRGLPGAGVIIIMTVVLTKAGVCVGEEGSQALLLRNLKAKEIINLVPL